MRRLVNTFYLVGFIVCVWAIFLALEISNFPSSEVRRDTGAAIVLGATVLDNQPTPFFEERIKYAIHLYRQGRVEKLIFTGGHKDGGHFSEAEVGRNYALDQGVPIEDIFLDYLSGTTRASLVAARDIMRSQGIHSAMIIGHPLLMRRAMAMAKDLQLQAFAEPAPSQLDTILHQATVLLQEIYFYQRYLILRA